MTNSFQESRMDSYSNPAYPLWTALITPLNEDGSIDFISLKSIADAQADALNGLLLLGSTGEGLALTTEESFSLVEFISNLNLPVPLMVAVGGYNLVEQVDWIRRCNKLNIHSYLLSTPLYAKPGKVGQTHWFTSLLNASEHPCMLYNVPSRSGMEIPIETIQKVQSHPNCWALKEASGDINAFLAYSQHCSEIDIYSGEDAMMPYLVHAGAKGLVSVCSNVWPNATKTYVEQCLSGNTSSMFPVWNNAVNELFCVANPIPVKILMYEKKMIKTPVLRAPLTHLELEDRQQLRCVEQQIEQWLGEINNPIEMTENNRLNRNSRNIA